MKLFTITTVLLMFLGTALEELEAPKNDPEITGMIVLSPKNTSRFGGGFYGRPQTASVSKASTDSALVVLSGIGTPDTDTQASPVILDQKDQRFSPNLLPVQLNDKVRIRNSDPVYHNVFSLSSTKKFDVGRRPKGEYLDVIFDKPGVVDVFCDIHSNMHAVIYVLPANAVSWVKVKSGEVFNLSKVPPGNYELTIFANGYEEQVLRIQVSENEPTDIGTITMNS